MRSAPELDLWRRAASIDEAIRVTSRQLAPLAPRRIHPGKYSRESMFASMRRGEPVIFDDLRLPVRGEERVGLVPAVIRALTSGLPPDIRVPTRCGRNNATRFLSAAELMVRWQNSRARVSITDLHVRGTSIMRTIDSSSISDFNLLAGTRGAIADQEMLTMVISSVGTFTDSHSDDPDGSNHCFVGKKLWLAWDTFEGLSHGLQDVERVHTCDDGAAFDMSAFLAMRSSRWFLIEPRQTLFLPGHLTHRVITLEDYLGIGSFFVMLPSYLRTLRRWTLHGPMWAFKGTNADRLALVDKITALVTAKIRALRRASERQRKFWGVDHLYASYVELEKATPTPMFERMFASAAAAELRACIREDLERMQSRVSRARGLPRRRASPRALSAAGSACRSPA